LVLTNASTGPASIFSRFGGGSMLRILSALTKPTVAAGVLDGGGTGVSVGVMLGVRVSVGVSVTVGVSVGSGVSVGVPVGGGVNVSVGSGVGVGGLSAPQAATHMTIRKSNFRIRVIPAWQQLKCKHTMKRFDLLR
jgi:hypothetical protein